MIKKALTLILSLFFILIFARLLNEYLNPIEIHDYEVVEIQGDIIKSPKYTSGPKAGSGSIVFRISQYPNLKFYFPHADYFHYKTNLEHKIKIGDEVNFSISKNDFINYVERKNSSKRGIRETINFQNMISVFTFRKASCCFLTLNLHNKLMSDDKKLLPVVLIFILIFYLYIIQIVWKIELYKVLESKGKRKWILFLNRINKKWS